ncbi:MAG: hypothetical protein J5599_03175 [Spirochaetales bacterium]|nr:hypothetical protein [Spirochaetales bacterium]
MKKAITILAVLIVLVGAVFADADPAVKPAGKERITVETKVDRELPVLRLVGALDESALETAGTVSTTVAQTGYAKEKDVTPEAVQDVSATANNGTILDAKSIDISHEDLKVYFKVSSAAARCDLVYSISVAAGQLKAVDNNTEYTIDKDVTFANQTAGAAVTNLAVTNVGGGDSAFTATATYSGATDAATIGTFDITWEKDNHAPEATYRADVTMTYTVQ